MVSFYKKLSRTTIILICAILLSFILDGFWGVVIFLWIPLKILFSPLKFTFAISLVFVILVFLIARKYKQQTNKSIYLFLAVVYFVFFNILFFDKQGIFDIQSLRILASSIILTTLYLLLYYTLKNASGDRKSIAKRSFLNIITMLFYMSVIGHLVGVIPRFGSLFLNLYLPPIVLAVLVFNLVNSNYKKGYDFFNFSLASLWFFFLYYIFEFSIRDFGKYGPQNHALVIESFVIAIICLLLSFIVYKVPILLKRK